MSAQVGMMLGFIFLLAIICFVVYLVHNYSKKKAGKSIQKISVQTSHNVVIEYAVASVGERMIAYFIDLTVVISYLMAISFLATELVRSNVPVYVYVILYLPCIFYDLISEIIMNGQSLGKRALDIKVIRTDGNPPTLSSYLLRWLTRLLEASIFGSLGTPAVLVIIVGGRGQRLGDIAAGTAVVKTRMISSNTEKFKLPYIEPDYQLVFPQVAQLNDRDAEILREVLEVYNENGNFEPVDVAARHLRRLLNIEDDITALELIEIVVRDYHYIASVAV